MDWIFVCRGTLFFFEIMLACHTGLKNYNISHESLFFINLLTRKGKEKEREEKRKKNELLLPCKKKCVFTPKLQSFAWYDLPGQSWPPNLGLKTKCLKKIENKLIKANWAVILEIAFLLLIVILKNLFLSKSVRKISRKCTNCCPAQSFLSIAMLFYSVVQKVFILVKLKHVFSLFDHKGL